MAKSLTKGAGINHLGMIRFSANGSGNLKVTAYSFNNFKSAIFSTIVLSSSSDKMPTSKGNFKRQRIQIEIKTEAIDEWFTVGQIIPFIKPLWTSYPNG